MEKSKEIQQQINELEDRIRLAPAGTPHKLIYEWFVELDRLKGEQSDLKTGQTDRQARIEAELQRLQTEADKVSPEEKAKLDKQIDRMLCELESLNDHYVPQGGNPDVNE